MSLKIGWENPSTLSRIEQGKIIPTKETVINIFEALEIPQEVVVCIFIKSNYLYTGEILTEKYIEKVTNSLISKIDLLKVPTFLISYPNDSVLHINNIGKKVFFGEEINSELENILLSGESFVNIIFNPNYIMKDLILNWEEFVKIIISNQHIIYNDTDKEREDIRVLKKFPRFNEFWEDSQNKTVHDFQSFNIAFKYNSPILGEIKFLIQETPVLEDNRFFIIQFIPATRKDFIKLESLK